MTGVEGGGGPRVVALGGGHGLAASLAALKRLTEHLTAIVTVADDGGSSGRLRVELGALPPGDLRMALVALAADDEHTRIWQRLYHHRFAGDGALAGHAVGNLLLTGLMELTGDPVAALEVAGRVLGARGRVLPLTTRLVEIVAEVADLDPADRNATTEVRGQVAVATTSGRVSAVRLEPVDPPATPEAVAAVKEADWIVLGPGSLFTSVIPHLLVGELRDAIAGSPARRLLTLNLAPQVGETSGYSPEAHLDALAAHAPDLRLDVVLADADAPDRDRLLETAAAGGGTVCFAPVRSSDHPARHDPERLARAYGELMRTAQAR